MSWNSLYETGVKELDCQNFDLLSRLDAMVDADSLAVRVQQLVHFEQVVTAYFEREQRMHGECGYYDADIHKFAHRSYLEHLGRIKWRFTEGKFTLENELIFMKDAVGILLKHIMDEDKSFAGFYHENILRAKAQ